MKLLKLGSRAQSKSSTHYRRNAQLYSIPLNEETLIYAPYEKTVAILTKGEFNHLKAYEFPNSKTPKEFFEAELYIGEGCQLPFTDKSMDRGAELRPTELILTMTNACQLRCKYCHSSSGELALSLPHVTADPALFMIGAYPSISRLLFHGWGEPTLLMPTIRKIVESSRKRITGLDITTNGVYYKRRKEYVDFLVENNFTVMVSYDGAPDLTDGQRLTANGESSNSEVIKTINALVRRYNNNKSCDSITVRITVSKLGERRIPEMVKHLHSMGVRKALIQPIIPSGRAENSVCEGASPPDLYAFSDSLLEAYYIGKEIGFQVSSSLLSFLSKPRCNFCSIAPLKAIGLTPELKLSACLEYTQNSSPFIVGELAKENGAFKVRLDEVKIISLRRRNGNLLDWCKSCPVKCGGGCAKVSWERHGNITVPGESDAYCDARVETLFKLLKHELLTSGCTSKTPNLVI